MSIASQYVTGRKVEIRVHPIVYKDANIRSVYNLCSSVPFEELTASLASAYTVSVLVADIQAFLYEGTYALCKVASSVNVAALASAYDLSTAVT